MYVIVEYTFSLERWRKMETITKITKDKGQFYLIWLTSGEKLRVSEDTLVRQRLLKGQELSEEMVEKIKKLAHMMLAYRCL